MKSLSYAKTLFLFLVGMFVVSAGYAEIFECNSGTVIELIANEAKCPDCPPPDKCPPVLACDEGYSCQKNVESPPPTGEKQQYPPAEAEVWVQSVTGGDLIDIPLDDSRWGGREVGEVYARENTNSIVWFWPNGGEATFDPTKLGSPAKWRDYRLSQPVGKPRSGTLNLSAGMRIAFNDVGNGGISVFEKVNTVKPPATGKCAVFLASYTNPEQSKLPAHRVYPMGQKMMLTFWLGRGMQRFANNGLTMHGPHWDTSNDKMEKYMRDGNAAGLRHAHRITHGVSTAKDLFEKMDNGAKEAQLFKQAKYSLMKVLNRKDWNDATDIWLTGTEELSTRMKTSAQKTKGLRYLKKMHKMVADYDPQKRPLWMSDVTGVSKSSMMVTHRYTDMVGPQEYLGRISPTGGYNTDAVMGDIARTIKATAVALDSQYPQLRPHVATASLDLLYEPIASRATTEMVNKIIKQWIYLGLNNGLQGFQMYAWYHYGSMTKTTRAKYYASYLAHIKELTDNKLDYAYLWGERRKDLSVKVISGPEKTHGYPSISMANIQYGRDRFVILTNSAEMPVKVEVGGFPNDCDKLFDIRTGKYMNLGVSVSPIIEPLGVRLYRISM